MNYNSIGGASWRWSYGFTKCNRYNIVWYFKVCQWLAASRWFSLGTPASSTNKTDSHYTAEILLKVTLNTITLTL